MPVWSVAPLPLWIQVVFIPLLPCSCTSVSYIPAAPRRFPPSAGGWGGRACICPSFLKVSRKETPRVTLPALPARWSGLASWEWPGGCFVGGTRPEGERATCVFQRDALGAGATARRWWHPSARRGNKQLARNLKTAADEKCKHVFVPSWCSRGLDTPVRYSQAM
ncbi:hypothetical protein GN956_G9337 [Arapaima gigas]